METNLSEKDLLAQGVGQVIGEVLGAFVGAINALRKQPGFNDSAFRAEIEALLKHPNATQLQQHAFQILLQSQVETPPPAAPEP
jgi:hypothetical protein